MTEVEWRDLYQCLCPAIEKSATVRAVFNAGHYHKPEMTTQDLLMQLVTALYTETEQTQKNYQRLMEVTPFPFVVMPFPFVMRDPK